MKTFKTLQKEAEQAPKFVLVSDEFGYDLFISDSSLTSIPVTDDLKEANKFSVGFDDETIKLKAWTFTSGYKLKVRYL